MPIAQQIVGREGYLTDYMKELANGSRFLAGCRMSRYVALRLLVRLKARRSSILHKKNRNQICSKLLPNICSTFVRLLTNTLHRPLTRD